MSILLSKLELDNKDVERDGFCKYPSLLHKVVALMHYT